MTKLLALLFALPAAAQIGTSGAGGGGSATVTITGDCTYSTPTIICTKTNGVAFGTMATQNANAVNITGGVVGTGTTPVSTVYGNTLSSSGNIFSYSGSIISFGTDVSMYTNGIATATNNYASGVHKFQSAFWNGSSNAGDVWTFGPSIGASGANPVSYMNLYHTGSTGIAAFNVQVPILATSLSTNQSAANGNTCTISGYVTLTLDGVSRKVAICQ